MAAAKKAALKLPGEGKPAKRSAGPAKKGEPVSKLKPRELTELLGKGAYPVQLDFSSPHYQLDVADFLASCPNVLKELDLTSNSLVELGPFDQVSRLKRLVADKNQLVTVVFRGLQNAVYVSLAQNRIEYLQPTDDLKKLENLNLQGNRLQGGFHELAKLKTLKVLDLGRNAIDLPIEQFYSYVLTPLKKLPKLSHLSFAENPVEVKLLHFRLFVINELPKLQYLDWEPVTKEERSKAALLESQKKWDDRHLPPKRASEKPAAAAAAATSAAAQANSLSGNNNGAAGSATLQMQASGVRPMDESFDTKARRLEALLEDQELTALVSPTPASPSPLTQVPSSTSSSNAGGSVQRRQSMVDPLDALIGGTAEEEDALERYLASKGSVASGNKAEDPLDEILNYLEDPLHGTFENANANANSPASKTNSPPRASAKMPGSPTEGRAALSVSRSGLGSGKAIEDVNYFDLLNEMIAAGDGATPNTAPLRASSAAPSARESGRASANASGVDYLDLLYDMIGKDAAAGSPLSSARASRASNAPMPVRNSVALQSNDRSRSSTAATNSSLDVFELLGELMDAPAAPAAYASRRSAAAGGVSGRERAPTTTDFGELEKTIARLEESIGEDVLRKRNEQRRREDEEAAKETERLRAEDEARQAHSRAEEDERRRHEDALLKTAAAEAAARAVAEDERRRQREAEEEAARVAEQQRRAAVAVEEEARRRALDEQEQRLREEEARLAAEDARQRQEQREMQRRAEEEARARAEEETRKRVEEESRRRLEEEMRIMAEEEARRKSEDEASRAAEEITARKRADEEAERRLVEMEKAEEARREASRMKLLEERAAASPVRMAAVAKVGSNRDPSIRFSTLDETGIAAIEADIARSEAVVRARIEDFRKAEEASQRQKEEQVRAAQQKAREDRQARQKSPGITRKALPVSVVDEPPMPLSRRSTAAMTADEKRRQLEQEARKQQDLLASISGMGAPTLPNTSGRDTLAEIDRQAAEAEEAAKATARRKAQEEESARKRKEMEAQMWAEEQREGGYTPAPAKVPQWRVQANDLALKERLGQGALGVTFRATWRRDYEVAIKKVRHGKAADTALATAFSAEADVAHALPAHPHLSQFMGVCTKEDLYLMFAYVPGVSLHAYLRNRVTHQWEAGALIGIAKEVADALAYLHASNLLHGAVKPHNVLIQADGHAVLTDFALLAFRSHAVQAGQVAAVEYWAPEVMEGQPQSSACDAYSFGLLLWECFARESPFLGILAKAVVAAVTQADSRPTMANETPVVCARLIDACWSRDPALRPALDKCVRILSQPVEQILKYGLFGPITPAPPSQPAIPPPAVSALGRATFNPNNGGTNAPLTNATAGGGVAMDTEDTKVQVVVGRALDLLKLTSEAQQVKACVAVASLAKHDENLVAMRKCGLVERLIVLLSSPSEAVQEAAARALAAVAEDENCSDEIRDDGGLPPLIRLLDSQPAVALQAAKALTKLAQNDANKHTLLESNVLPALVRLVRGDSEPLQLQAAWALSYLLESPAFHTPLDQAGGVDALAQLATATNPGLQLAVLVALGALIVNDALHARVRSLNVLGRFVKLLVSRSPLLQQQALRSVQKFAEYPALRDELYTYGALKTLLELVGGSDESITMLALNCILRFCRSVLYVEQLVLLGGLPRVLRLITLAGAPIDMLLLVAQHVALMCDSEKARDAIRSGGGVPIIVGLLSSSSDDCKSYALTALLRLCSDRAPVLLDVKPVVDLLDSNDDRLQGAAVATVLAVLRSPEALEHVRAAGGIPHLVNLLASSVTSVRDTAALSLAILAEQPAYRSEIVRAGGVYPLMSMTSTRGMVRERVLWAISNIALEVEAHKALRDCGAADTLVQLLDESDVSVVSLAIKTILMLAAQDLNKAMIMAAGGKERLEALVARSTNAIVQQACKKALAMLS